MYPDAEVPRFSGVPLVPEVFAGAFGLLCGITSAVAYAVTVANTVPVSISSQIPGVAAADPSNDTPHSITRMGTAGLTCSIVLMLVPVVTFAALDVVGIAPL